MNHLTAAWQRLAAPRRYERVTFRSEGGRAKTVFLQDPVETGHFLRGTQVDKEGNEVQPSAAYLRANNAEFGDIVHVLDLGLVTKREPYEMDLMYGWLVPQGTATDVSGR